jgi:hypothetical protein
MAPPVFGFDEKTQVQVLDRTQPSLPLKAGRAGTLTHDYKRNGTTDLSVAMNVRTWPPVEGGGALLVAPGRGHRRGKLVRPGPAQPQASLVL